MLLERDSALASLQEYASDATRGDGRFVLLAGEAGAGKSSLVEQLEQDRPEPRWAWGACDGLFTPRPLGPLFDIAGRLGGDLLGKCQARAPRDELFTALQHQLATADTPHIVVIEDVHWADEATIDLLRFLARRLRGVPAMVIATYRDDALATDDKLQVALGEVATQRATRRIGLGPLSAAAVATLAAGSGLDAAELHRLTNGNPFFVTEVLRATADGVPPSARDAVLSRAARLSPAAREVLETAALAGTRVELGLLTADPVVLDELLGSGLLQDEPGGLRFRHEIARLAVAQAVPAHRGIAINTGILVALRSLGCTDDARLAYHADAAGDADAVVAHALPAAQRASELGAHREAAAQCERALRYADHIDDLASVYEAYAYEVSMLDRWEDAAAAGTRALELWRATGNRRREGDMLRRLSRTMWRLCRSDEANAAASAAIDVLEPLGASMELGWAYANLANQRLLDRDTDVTIEFGERAVRIAEELDLPAVRSDALNTIATARAAADGVWEEQLRAALDIAITHNLPSQAGRAYANLYAGFVDERRFADAEAVRVEGLAYCEERDMDVYTTCLRGEQANVLAKTGGWAAAITLSGQLLRQVASPINRINPLTSLGTVRARRGEAGVWKCLDEAAEAAAGSREPEWIITVGLARTEALWLAGRDQEAVREAESLAGFDARCGAWERGAITTWLRRTGSDLRLDGPAAAPYTLMLNGENSAAAAAWISLGCPYDAALAQFDDDSEPSLRAALTSFEALGSGPAAHRTRQKMRQVGVRSIPAGRRATTRANPAGLTRREHEVLDLINGGHTNAEIAAKLFISTKTVDHHVSALLAKLDAPNRGAAARKATALGLLGTAPDADTI